jgi:1-acyl-sn-glycerol-3-phosphate acyltransferase
MGIVWLTLAAAPRRLAGSPLVMGWIVRLLVLICTRCTTSGIENTPREGAAIVVFNHLGDADPLIGMTFLQRQAEYFAKAELYKYPILGKIMDAYGVIWVHRGTPDRRALRAALDALNDGRLVGIAPEGRESLTGALEEGTGGAAFLRVNLACQFCRSRIPAPITARLYHNFRHFKRTRVTLTVGKLFKLEAAGDRHEAIQKGTQQIMQTLANLLPAEYRGVYQSPHPQPMSVYEATEAGGQNGSG